jgi:2-desacetyl-2-hydroxyethyl bacteriochlorophyllide A dehydrogenase
VHLIPEGLSVRDAAWTEPLAAAARGVSHGAVGAGSTVAVLGAGAIGQLVLQLVLNVGVGETLVVEPSQLRRKVAVACGASSVLSPEQLDEVDRQFDVVFDCTGSPQALASTLSLVGHGGRVVVLGSYTSPITLDSVKREATLVFSAVYRNSEEFAGALRLLSRGVVDVAPLTTAALPLEHFEDAFAAMRDPDRSVKVLLAPMAE